MIRRRRLRHSNGIGFNELTMQDYYAASYYLYLITDYLFKSANSEFGGAQISLFFRLLDKLKHRQQFSQFLEDAVKSFESEGKLTRIIEDPNRAEEPSTSRKSRRPSASFDPKHPVEYNQDIDIEISQLISRDDLKADKDTLNLYRFLYIEGKTSFLSIIENFILRKAPQETLCRMEKIPSHIMKAVNDYSSLIFLTDALTFTEEEKKFLIFSYRFAIIPYLTDLFDEVDYDLKDTLRQDLIGISKKDYLKVVKKTGALRSFGFINEDDKLEGDFIECILNQDLNIFFGDLVKEADCNNAYPLESFSVNKNATKVMQKILEGSENVSLLLYGNPGSGKTEYAKSLAKFSGLKPLIFKNEVEIQKYAKGNDNVICRLNLFLSIERNDSILIIDEADTLLKTKTLEFFGMNSPSPIKGTVNKMLENSKNKIIWIVNFTNQIDISTLRRFNFSCRFDAMSKEQLRNITQSKLESLNLESGINSEILGLMEKYSVTGASVDNVVKTIKSLGETNQNCLMECVNTILKENQQLINGKSKIRDKVSSNYDINALNTSMNPKEIVQMIRNAQKFAEKNKTSENGIRMLFYGLSGTGKTEFARYISKKLGKKILLKRASDILNQYVGGTEQNIKYAFEEAERTDSILLLDEADSFFASRENAHNSWERTQVNELLTQMEEFSGILICTTNLRNIMDGAMNRRFHMIVEFKSLTKEGIKCMVDRYFSAYDFTGSQIERLELCSSITPGDFGILANRIRFMTPENLNSSYITEELLKIQEEKADSAGRRSIGFCL